MKEHEIEIQVQQFKRIAKYIYYDEAVALGNVVGELTSAIRRLNRIQEGEIFMSSFICEECGCIDNTAMNNSYWSRLMVDMYNDRRILCQECSPREYVDGTSVETSWCGDRGTWHNRFPKVHWSDIGRDIIMVKCGENNGTYINAIEYFKKIDEVSNDK